MGPTSEPEWFLSLLNGWTLTRAGRRVKVAHRQQRLITALALLGPRPRTFLSGLLWPDSSEAQAAVGLRVSIWHINHELPGLLDADGATDVSVSLSERVRVDITDLERDFHTPASELHRSYERWERLRTARLLPGWYEDWVLAEQERFRGLRAAALDSVAAYQLSQGNAEETKAATALAIALEPFRESSHRLLIQAHLATGDLVSALRTYRSFSEELREEFGVDPSPSLTRLIHGAVRASGRQNAQGVSVRSHRDGPSENGTVTVDRGAEGPKNPGSGARLQASDVLAVTSQSPGRVNAGRPSGGLPSPIGKSAETVSRGKNIPSVQPSWRPDDEQKRLEGDVGPKSNDPGSLSPRNRTPGQRTLPTKTSSAVNLGRNSPGPGTGSSTPTESRISAPNRSAAPSKNPDHAARTPPATLPRCEKLRRSWLVLNHNDLLPCKCRPVSQRQPEPVETGQKSTPTLHPGPRRSRGRGCGGTWPRKSKSVRLASARSVHRSVVPELSSPPQWESHTGCTLSRLVYCGPEAGRMASEIVEQLARGSPKNDAYASFQRPWQRRLRATPGAPVVH